MSFRGISDGQDGLSLLTIGQSEVTLGYNSQRTVSALPLFQSRTRSIRCALAFSTITRSSAVFDKQSLRSAEALLND